VAFIDVLEDFYIDDDWQMKEELLAFKSKHRK